jgi:eukaryotic-like serine/threonine-protein kinase
MSFEPGRWTAARALFEELLDLPGTERSRRLAGLEDEALRADVERLLAADSDAGSFLESPALAVAGGLLDGLLQEPETPLPDAIGPYRILSRLGRGGMGEVLLGERADGLYEQRVAIKLLRRGMDSDEVLVRFSRERRILARLEHPHIAHLLDGGATEDGRPYFVMELVEGEPITEYCRSRSLSVEERIRLVLDGCDAVSAAHRRLIVHRDLKPSNVLVTPGGDVKLLDFGIAKLLSRDETDPSETRTDLRLLTPAYAAPEQLLGEPVTTATDVWALGALLYEMLTGTLPQKREGRTGQELASAVSQDTVERASARVAREPLAALPVAAPSEAERRKVRRRLRGDLDNILRMALRREPERRYGSAAALADDLRRHLAGRPVRARSDTVGYRLGKFVRRQKVAVAAGALILLTLLGGLAATAWQARRAEKNAVAAAASARRAEGVKEFLIGLFEVADPEQASGGAITASELLDQAGKRLETELASEPDIQADLLEAVARIDKGLGRLEPAESLAKRSLEIRERIFPPGDAAIGRSLATLGAVKMSKGELDAGEKELSRALPMLRAKEGPESLATARAQSDYGQVLFWKGEVERAEKSERGVYETYRRVLGDDHVLTALHLRNLGVLLDEIDRLDESEKAYRDSQAVLTKRLGPEHASLGSSYANLAVLLGRRGKNQEAEALYKRSLEVRRKTLGPNHPMLGQTLQLSAVFYLNQGRLEESEAAYREALALFRAINPKHFEIGKCLNGFALIASRRGRHAEAEKTMIEVEALFREVLGEKHPFTWQIRGNRATQIALQGRLEEAEGIQREVAGKLAELNGKDSGEAVDARSRLGETLRKRGRIDEALPLHRQSLEVMLRLEGETSPGVALERYQLAADLIAGGRSGDRSEARRLLEQSIATLEKQSPPHQRLAEIQAASAKLR